jgi:hypothetical protein
MKEDLPTPVTPKTASMTLRLRRRRPSSRFECCIPSLGSRLKSWSPDIDQEADVVEREFLAMFCFFVCVCVRVCGKSLMSPKGGEDGCISHDIHFSAVSTDFAGKFKYRTSTGCYVPNAYIRIVITAGRHCGIGQSQPKDGPSSLPEGTWLNENEPSKRPAMHSG